MSGFAASQEPEYVMVSSPPRSQLAFIGMPSLPRFSVGGRPFGPRMAIIANGSRVLRFAEAVPVPSSSRVHMPSRQSNDV